MGILSNFADNDKNNNNNNKTIRIIAVGIYFFILFLTGILL